MQVAELSVERLIEAPRAELMYGKEIRKRLELGFEVRNVAWQHPLDLREPGNPKR